MNDVVVIDRRFNGPPASANGGYSCGLLAEALAPVAGDDDAIAVTLRLPPPLDTPLERARRDDGAVLLRDDGTVVAEATLARLDATPPPAPDSEAAARAADRYSGHSRHAFPTCFVCGPRRGTDGLRIFAGPTGGNGMVAAPWTPPRDLATDGVVHARVLWAALDCPSYFACASARAAVLGRLTARLLAPVEAGAPYVVAAWPLGRERRKHHAGSAVYTAAGEPVAIAEAIWIELEDPGSFAARG